MVKEIVWWLGQSGFEKKQGKEVPDWTHLELVVSMGGGDDKERFLYASAAL